MVIASARPLSAPPEADPPSPPGGVPPVNGSRAARRLVNARVYATGAEAGSTGVYKHPPTLPRVGITHGSGNSTPERVDYKALLSEHYEMLDRVDKQTAALLSLNRRHPHPHRSPPHRLSSTEPPPPSADVAFALARRHLTHWQSEGTTEQRPADAVAIERLHTTYPATRSRPPSGNRRTPLAAHSPLWADNTRNPGPLGGIVGGLAVRAPPKLAAAGGDQPSAPVVLQPLQRIPTTAAIPVITVSINGVAAAVAGGLGVCVVLKTLFGQTPSPATT
eukprot:Hpha_TRINITY_DN13703_c0_g2::TRINITY_DN13703_c0_g2_i1::g.142460::m.142460